jgi:hypothetical protein
MISVVEILQGLSLGHGDRVVRIGYTDTGNLGVGVQALAIEQSFASPLPAVDRANMKPTGMVGGS